MGEEGEAEKEERKVMTNGVAKSFTFGLIRAWLGVGRREREGVQLWRQQALRVAVTLLPLPTLAAVGEWRMLWNMFSWTGM